MAVIEHLTVPQSNAKNLNTLSLLITTNPRLYLDITHEETEAEKWNNLLSSHHSVNGKSGWDSNPDLSGVETFILIH